MGIDREELKKAVDMLPEEKLAVLQKYMNMLQRSNALKNKDFNLDTQGDPILNVLGCLSGKPLTAQQIEEELYKRNNPHV
jgi:pyruvate/2-oxoacid:ferredoxin oxidoreductase alpha subunit